MIQISPAQEEIRRRGAQLQGEGEDAEEGGSKGEGSQGEGNPYMLSRILYALVLMGLLVAISFYFQLLQDYDLLSLLLGFVVCIILQFSFLSYCFERQMRRFKMDEVGILKWKIKLLFGDLNLDHVERKNRIKYYRHENNDSDRLFCDENESIYQNVMTSLRGKEEVTFKELIEKARQKWSFLQQKITLMDKFLRSVLKQYESRKSIYARYKNVILKMKDKEDFRDWQAFLTDHHPRLADSTTYYSQLDEPHATPDEVGEIKLNWGVFHWFAVEKVKLNEKEIRDIKMYIVEEFQGLVETVQKEKDSHTKKREKCLADYRWAINEKTAIERDKAKIILKIKSLQAKLEENRIKQGNQVEGILKDEFDLRLYKIEYENYEVKMSRARSTVLSSSELLNSQIEMENRDLETFLKTFNGKINQYINQIVGYGETRTPDIKTAIQELKEADFKHKSPQQDPLADSMVDEMVEKFYGRRKQESSLKGYLVQMANLFKELKNNHQESKRGMEEYRGKLEKMSNSENRGEGIIQTEFNAPRLHYYASSVNDQNILRMFSTLNAYEEQLTNTVAQLVDSQIKTIHQFEEDIGSLMGKDIKKLQEDLKRKDEELRKVRKRGQKPEEEGLMEETNRLRQKICSEIKNYHDNHKIPTCLLAILKSMIESQHNYEHYAAEVDAEEKYQLENRQKTQGEDRRTQKYTAFLNLMSKYDTNEFDDDSLMKQDTFSLFGTHQTNEHEGRKGKPRQPGEGTQSGQLVQYKQTHIKSMQMVNKLLGVLFNEWCNSEFFHDFVKEELLVSLNRKRPGVVDNLNIQYFKIVEKDKSVSPVKNIKVHNSEIYRCLFDLTLNFKGKIAVQIGTKLRLLGSKFPLQIKLLIREFECPIRVCFTPFSLGKSYASLLQRPRMEIDYTVTVKGYRLTKIPLFTSIIKTYIVLKLRKKMLWPKRMTLSVPLAYKSTIDIAIQQRLRYERDREKLEKKYK